MMGTTLVLIALIGYCGYIGYRVWIKKDSCCGGSCHCAAHPQQNRKKAK